MYKKLIGSLFILVLIGIVIYNLTDEDSTTQDSVIDVSGDSSIKGTTIVSPDTPKGIAVGEKAPDFTLNTLDGKKVSLSDFRGKKVFLNFWATWCGPCKIEMPEMQRFTEEFGDQVEVLAVNATGTANESAEKVEEFLSHGEFTFTTLLDPDSKVSDAYKLIGIPTTYFIGTDGTVQAERIVGPMTYEYMKEMMNKIN